MIPRGLGLLLLLVAALLWGAPAHGRTPPVEAEPTLGAAFKIRATQTRGFQPEGDGFTLGEDESAGTLLSEVYASEWEFMALGVTWATPLPANTLPSLDVRTSDDGRTWGAWTPLHIEGEDRPDKAAPTFTDLLFTTGRYAQVRATLRHDSEAAVTWEGLKLTVIDGRPGPSAQDLAQQSVAAVDARAGEPRVISRAAWGANESYRYNREGDEIWPREFHPLKAMFVHHTATSSNPTDPAAAVRAIYYYHAVTNGWGDIGYHYLVDQYGNLYEGRFASEQNGQVAEAGHAGGYNQATMGISVIGNFTNVAPGAGSVEAVKAILASRGARYGINPQAPVFLQGGYYPGRPSPDRWFNHALMGHLDSHTPRITTCPGELLYNRLDEIRRDVAARINGSVPSVQLLSPTSNAWLDGIFSIEASTSSNVTRVEYHLISNGLNGTPVQSFLGANDGSPWRGDVDSHSLPAGRYTLRATAKTAVGTTATDERTINIAPFQWTDPTPYPPNVRMFLPIMQVRSNSTCQSLVRNSTFSTNTDWLMVLGPHAARYDDARWVSPPQSLRVGMAWGENYWAYSSAWLPLTLPGDAARATLTLKYLPEASGESDNDQQYLQIRSVADPYGTPLADIIPTARRHETAWQSLTYDLNAFRGQDIYLYIGAFNDGNGGPASTRLYVDDVQVTVCR